MTDADRLRALLEPALAYAGGTHEWRDVVDGILSGRMQLWDGGDAAAVTEIHVYPRKKVLHVFLAGGDMGRLLEMTASAAAWGKAQGCTSMTLTGRRGWRRVYGARGWSEIATTMAMEL